MQMASATSSSRATALAFIMMHVLATNLLTELTEKITKPNTNLAIKVLSSESLEALEKTLDFRNNNTNLESTGNTRPVKATRGNRTVRSAMRCRFEKQTKTPEAPLERWIAWNW
uniref:Putative secreted peptide n=1 Tax=Anopheles braziliensis TaxID=58242 RepID=A0A2M3ZQV5_9DIPT